ncbi:MAG: bifunctional 2-polyprenyl-6-hydroxyphenol methylase/3-demethylubiquinol 3-O-methyltransferase UbiG [Pseudomonadales bacterium]
MSKPNAPATELNLEQAELHKFEQMASRWWDTSSEFKPLHEINPLRLGYISSRRPLEGLKVVDIGCGGGILAEALAREGAQVKAIDMADGSLNVARLHLLESGLEVDYQKCTAEQLAEKEAGQYDLVTCLEMLEHVPDPASVVNACSRLLKPDGDLFLSTINRNPKAWLFAVVGAEYILQMLKKGTHDYQKFIKPSELTLWSRKCGLSVKDITGMTYNPISKSYALSRDVDVNYLMHLTAAN